MREGEDEHASPIRDLIESAAVSRPTGRLNASLGAPFPNGD
jgi:hypothetical protein